MKIGSIIGMILLWGCGEESIQSSQPSNEPSAIDIIEHVQTLEKMTITTQVWPRNPTLGDPIHLSLMVTSAENLPIQLPPFGEALGRFDIVDFRPRESQTSNQYSWSQQYTLQPMNSGLLTIPSLRISSTESEWLTEPVSLSIASILPNDAQLEFRPYRTQLPKLWKQDPKIWTILILSALGMATGVFWVLRPQKTRVPQQNPWEEAQAALAELHRQQSSIDDAELALWIANLSIVLRRYMQRRFAINALEQTTEELALHLPQIFVQEGVSEAIYPQVMSFFMFCDEVKFAKVHYQREKVFSQSDFVQNFLKETFVQAENAEVTA